MSMYKYFSELMKEQWKLKKSLSKKVSNNKIDNLYEYSLKNGANCGKILGAGGGGFMMFFCNSKRNKLKLKTSLKKMITVDFNLDLEGTKIIYG